MLPRIKGDFFDNDDIYKHVKMNIKLLSNKLSFKIMTKFQKIKSIINLKQRKQIILKVLKKCQMKQKI